MMIGFLECSAADSNFSLSIAIRSSASASVRVSLSRVLGSGECNVSYSRPGEGRNPSPQLQPDGTNVKEATSDYSWNRNRSLMRTSRACQAGAPLICFRHQTRDPITCGRERPRKATSVGQSLSNYRGKLDSSERRDKARTKDDACIHISIWVEEIGPWEEEHFPF